MTPETNLLNQMNTDRTIPSFINSRRPWIGLGMTDVRDCKPCVAYLPFPTGQKRELVSGYVRCSLKIFPNSRKMALVSAAVKSAAQVRSAYSSAREAFRASWSITRNTQGHR
jgi:hypothetical protein